MESSKPKVRTIMDLITAVKRLEGQVRDLVNTPRLHRKDLMQRYNICEATLHRWIRKRLLPDPVRFTGPLWRLADLEAAEASGQIPRPVSA